MIKLKSEYTLKHRHSLYSLKKYKVTIQAFLILLKKIEDDEIQMVHSVAIKYEIDKLSEWEVKEKILSYLNLAKEYIHINNKIEKRSLALEELSILGIDALHIAIAEAAKVDYFITCDDKLLKRYKRNKDKFNIKIVTLFEIIGVIYNVENN